MVDLPLDPDRDRGPGLDTETPHANLCWYRAGVEDEDVGHS